MLCRLAGKFRAPEAQIYAFSKSAGGNLTHPVLPWKAARLAIGALTLHHSWADLAGDAAHTNLHYKSSDDVVHNYPALADLADEVRHFDVLGVLLIAGQGLFAEEL